jgi:hypothetical protein
MERFTPVFCVFEQINKLASSRKRAKTEVAKRVIAASGHGAGPIVRDLTALAGPPGT